MEKTTSQPGKEPRMSYPSSNGEAELGSVSSGPKGPAFTRFVDSFRQNKGATVTPEGVVGADGKVFKAEEGVQYVPELAHKLKTRHLQMIAIGGSIGTGLFVGSGSALANGGPASLLIAFGLIGIMLFCTVHALGEMAVAFPVAGSFAAYSTRFLDPAWGFAMGWNYALQWMVTLPLEIIAASITISYWDGAKDINPAVFVTIFLFVIIAINFFGVRGYAESEFVFSIIKVAAVIGFILLGIILNTGGGPNHVYTGAKYWHDPGPFNNGFKGLCSVFVTAAFAFSGTELVGLAAAETENPRKSLPKAVKQVFWRITLFYMVSLTIVGVLVPYNNAQLLNGTGSTDVNASPFVIAIKNAGVSGVPSVMNVVIMIAVLSVGNSAVYGASRTLAGLAEQGQAPKILAYIDRAGRPLISIIVASSFGFLCYLVAAGTDARTQAFDWMLSISGLAAIFTWGSICLCHIRFRQAWKHQGRTLDELAFKSQAGVIGSWFGLIFNFLVLVAQFWTGFAPVGYASMTTGELVTNFFQVYLAAPIILVCYICFKIVKKTSIVRIKDIDLQTGMRELNVQQLIEEEKMEKMSWSWYKRAWNVMC